MILNVTKEEVSALHNARCYLLYALNECDETFKETSSFVKNLRRSLKELDPVAKRLTAIQDEINDRRDATAKRIGELNGFTHSIWSMYEVESFEALSPVPSGAKLISWYADKDTSVTVEGITWLDLWKATDKLIGMTADEHGDHVFVEGYRKVGDNLYEVQLGS